MSVCCHWSPCLSHCKFLFWSKVVLSDAHFELILGKHCASMISATMMHLSTNVIVKFRRDWWNVGESTQQLIVLSLFTINAVGSKLPRNCHLIITFEPFRRLAVLFIYYFLVLFYAWIFAAATNPNESFKCRALGQFWITAIAGYLRQENFVVSVFNFQIPNFSVQIADFSWNSSSSVIRIV